MQRWFDQGHTLLHHFWYYEAERAFRWCLKLEPENAMAYWGLARAAQDGERSKKFLDEAIKRKGKVSERERLYIEAWARALPGRSPPRRAASGAASSRRRWRRIAIKYPDDIEAKALLAHDSLGQNRYANDVMLKKVLAAAPDHPGAHHYRIHLWDDGPNGAHALDSCAAYTKVATGVGHALHMPGHIYGQLGMWHEAAIAMDSAARVEAGYLRKRMKFPFNSWNYAHNRDYLSYLQEQLGLPSLAIAGARELLDGPARAKDDEPDKTPLLRALVKFERWKELLDEKAFGWRDTLADKVQRHYVEALAHIGLGNLDKAAKSMAAHAALAAEVRKPENSWRDRVYTANALELKGRLALARGETLNGIGFLSEAARKSQAHLRRARRSARIPARHVDGAGAGLSRGAQPGPGGHGVREVAGDLAQRRLCPGRAGRGARRRSATRPRPRGPWPACCTSGRTPSPATAGSNAPGPPA